MTNKTIRRKRADQTTPRVELLATFVVDGKVTHSSCAGVGALRVRIVDKNVGKDILLTEVVTGGKGEYRATFTADTPTKLGKERLDLQARVYSRDGNSFLGASNVCYNAARRETLNVLLPEQAAVALPSEYETLLGVLAGQYRGDLADLKETGGQQDITYLANKTGWDAKAVAFAALAEQFSRITVPLPRGPRRSRSKRNHRARRPRETLNLKPELYYALFRAGLPANPDGLFQITPKTARLVWEQSIKQGLIPQTFAGELDSVARSFESLSAVHILDTNPPIGISTIREMLQTSLSNPAQQEHFAQTYIRHRDDPEALWSSLERSLGKAATRKLQLNGQLYYLTLNNGPLVVALHAAEKRKRLTSTLDLVPRGYYDPTKWIPLIGDSIPSHIPGDGAEEKRTNYAKLLATKVRLSFPTAVAADLVRRGIFKLSDQSVTPAHVADFLVAHQEKFAIGMEPVEAYISRTKLGRTRAPVIAQIKRLQRVYQITPDDQVMAVLLQHDLDSAHAIMRYDAAGFARAFQAKLGGAAKAQEIHERARQIHNAVLNIVVSYLGARVAPTLGGRSPVFVPFASPAPRASSAVIAYPTLESLFGSLDYCNCPECRSILSPAAYLVDLFQFLDQLSPTAGYRNPQEVLFERRPDLQYLALTCENTNTALPYIDVVNETLEYYVANNSSLTNYRGHDTDGSVSSRELMASPQYVNEAAYDTLKSVFFPPPLPFNRPLELLRLHLGKLGLNLSDAMATLRVDDAVDRASPTTYGWRDILMEELSISREEYELLMDSSLKLQGLYGYPDLSDDAVLSTLQNTSLQDFSRRTGVSYEDLFSIVKTQFINPNAILIPRLEKLGVPFATLEQLRSGRLDAEQFKKLLPDGLDTHQYGDASDYDGIVQWLQAEPRILRIITITDPSNGPDQCSGATLQFRYADSTNPLLTIADFVKLIRFIRLWRKLGLSVGQTDDILTALFPAEDLPKGANDGADLALLDKGFLVLLPRAGFLFRIIRQLALNADSDLAALLACWAPIGTAGNNSLYRRMFLGPTVQELGAQIAAISGPVSAGDQFATKINGIPIPLEGLTAQAYDTATTLATAIASAINGTQTIDPDTDQSLNRRIVATSLGGVITIKAGFILECATDPGGTESYTSVSQTPLSHTATVAGLVTPGDVLVTTINGFSIRYKVAAGDTPSTIATNIALAINDTTPPDPFSGLPLNTLVVASSQAELIAIDAVNAGAPFRLNCSIPPPTGTYAAAATTFFWTATVTGSPRAAVAYLTLINGVGVTYVVEGSLDEGSIAAGIADTINQTSAPDPITNLPLNTVVRASSSGGVVTITPNPEAYVDLQGFLVECIVPSGVGTDYESAGPLQAPQTTTVAGRFAGGTVLTTVIDGIAVLYTVANGDNETSIANNIAATINATTTPDQRQASQPPLNTVVSASAQSGVLTIISPSLSLFSLESSWARSVYLANDASPEFWTATLTTGAGTQIDTTTLTTTINGVTISTVQGPTNRSPGSFAEQIIEDINSSSLQDSGSGQPLNSLIQASVENANVRTAVIRIVALVPAFQFTLACSSVGSAEGGGRTGQPPRPKPSLVREIDYTADGPFEPTRTATVAGTITVGSLFITTINGIAIAYTAVAGDTAATVASNIAKAINTTATIDAVSKLPLNQLVSASSNSGVITVAPTGAFPFTMACSLILPPPATYLAGRRPSPFADDGYGNFLQDKSQTLFGHEPTLRAAFNLTGTEFTQIAKALGYTRTTLLTLDNVSAVFRMGWLAHTLRLSLIEFLTLRQVTGLDPFAALDPGTTPPAEPPVVRFVGLLQALAGAGLQPVQVLYLIWNQDVSGKAAPALTDVTGLARTLRADFAGVEAQFTLKDDPDGSIAKGLMGLVYGDAATSFFFGLLNDTLVISVAYSNPQPNLAQPIIEASAGRLSYDDLRKQLRFTGVLDPATQAKIDAAITANGDSAALHQALADLVSASQRTVGPFFTAYPELLPLYTLYAASSDPLQQRRTALLASFLPGLKQKRKREQALATITSSIGTDPSFATSFLQDATVLHAAAEVTDPAVTDLTAIETPGLSYQFFAANNPGLTPNEALDSVGLGFQTATIGGTVTVNDILTTTIAGVSIAYTVVAADSTLAILAGHVAAAINATGSPDPVTKLPLNQVVCAFPNGNVITLVGLDPAGTSSFSVSNGATETYTAGSATPVACLWSGYVDAPQDGFYDVYVNTDPGATVSLQIGGVEVLMAQANNAWSNQSAITLKAGALTSIVLTATSVRSTLSVTWAGLGLGRAAIPGEALYSATLVDHLTTIYVRFLKAASLATTLSLTANEIADLSAATNFRVNTTDGRDNVPAGSTTLTPASMSNIIIGSKLVIDAGAAREVVTVTGITAATFSAAIFKPHDGTAVAFPIVGQAFPDIGRGWLNFLSGSSAPDPGVGASLRDVLIALLNFARIKRALSPKDERLMAVLQNPALSNGSPAILTLTGWTLESLNALLQRFFGSIESAALSSIENLSRIYDAFRILRTCRTTASALIAATSNAPSPVGIGTLQAALRAQYAEPDWAALVRPINDTMRILQRDALVAYSLQQFGGAYEESIIRSLTLADAPGGSTLLELPVADLNRIKRGMRVQGTYIAVYATVSGVNDDSVQITPGLLAALPKGTSLRFVPQDAVEIDTADRLFEYFLIDAETQPAVETSRIRLALSSVQLFIERILRNLEPSCAPNDVDDPVHPRWPWMKRYRVWQANREVFLWPENWLYPELRDDRSPFFQETMSALLQSDITDDAAASAYLDYLTKLEAVAKLEPCGLYDTPPDPKRNRNETAYALARTAGGNRKHYFRQYQRGPGWAPWTEVKIDCDDMPITPIIWNGRLFLFWLKVQKQTLAQTIPSNQLPQGGLAGLDLDQMQSFAKLSVGAQQSSMIVQAALCWSEFYSGKWQPAKTSDINRPTNLGTFDLASFDADRNRWRIVPVLNLPAGMPKDALALSIQSPSMISQLNYNLQEGLGFFLYNTHSLPVRFEDANLGPIPPTSGATTRLFDPFQAYTGGPPQSSTFGIGYYSYDDTLADWKQNVFIPILGLSQAPRYVESAARFEAWDAPFFFEDSRNVFYVTSTPLQATISLYRDFGILSARPVLQGPEGKIPLRVSRQARGFARNRDSLLEIHGTRPGSLTRDRSP